MGKAALAFAFGASLATLSTRSAAAPDAVRPGVVIAASECARLPWSRDAWLALLRVELAADEVTLRSTGGAEEAHVVLDAVPCDASAATARLTLALGGATTVRSIDLHDIDPVARPRALAIAMAQLIREAVVTKPAVPSAKPTPVELDVHLELEAPPAIAAPPPVVVPAASLLPLPRPPADATHPIGIVGAAESRLFASGTGLFGGRVGAYGAITPSVLVLGDVGLLGSVAHDPLGTIDVTVGTVGAQVLATRHLGPVTLGVGPRFEVGVGWFRGEAASATIKGASVTSPLAFFAMTAAGWFRVAGPVEGFVAIDGGAPMYGFSPRADGRYAGDISGAMLSLRLGFAWGFGQAR